MHTFRDPMTAMVFSLAMGAMRAVRAAMAAKAVIFHPHIFPFARMRKS